VTPEERALRRALAYGLAKLRAEGTVDAARAAALIAALLTTDDEPETVP
jgi:hypothetical protein